jgi:exocyst complex component 2
MSHFNLEISPHLLNLFQNLFSIQLSDETARIRDVLTQLDTQLFKSYTKPHALQIAAWIETGIFSPRWAAGASAPNKRVADLDPSPYVSTVLLHLVTLHSQTSTTSPNSPLTGGF